MRYGVSVIETNPIKDFVKSASELHIFVTVMTLGLQINT